MCKRTVIARLAPPGWFIEGSGVLYLTLKGLQLYPALRGEKLLSARIPVLFTRAVPAAASADEIDILRQIFVNGTHLEKLSSSISSHHIEADVNTLIRLRASSLQHASKGYWITCGLTATGIVLILFITYYFTQVYIWNLFKGFLIVTAQQLVVIRSLNLKVCYLRNQVLLVLNVRIGLSQTQKGNFQFTPYNRKLEDL